MIKEKSKRGGARPGAGRKKIPLYLKKIPVGYKLRRWIVEWLRAQPVSAASLIEEALQQMNKLKKPKG